MALFNWGRKNAPALAAVPALGLDWTGSRLVVARQTAVEAQALPLEGEAKAFPLAVGLGDRALLFGQAVSSLRRKEPHRVCGDYLGNLDSKESWTFYRRSLTPLAAFQAILERVQPRLPNAESAVWCIPGYLSEPAQRLFRANAARLGLPLRKFALPELLLARERAASLDGHADDEFPSWHPSKGDSETKRVVVIQADGFALSGSLIRIESEEAKLELTKHWPKFNEHVWHERLLNALSDRCVRICRRDPRDSADSEQMLYDQLEPALDTVRFGRKVTITVRAATWYQDLLLSAEDFQLLASPLLKPCVDQIVDWLRGTQPDEVWFRAEAGRLPGLPIELHQRLAERTRVRVLPPEAVALAAARHAKSLPEGTFDSTIPLEAPRTDPVAEGSVR